MIKKIEPPKLLIQAFGHKKTDDLVHKIIRSLTLKNHEQILNAVLMIYFLFIIPYFKNRNAINYKFGKQFVNNLEELLLEAMNVELNAIISEKNDNQNNTIH